MAEHLQTERRLTWTPGRVALPLLTLGAAVTLGLYGCGDEAPVRPAADVVATILDAAHGKAPDRADFSTLACELRTAPGADPTTILIADDGRMRVVHAGEVADAPTTTTLIHESAGWAWTGSGRTGATPIDTDEFVRLTQLRDELRAAYFAPLATAAPRRIDATHIALGDSDWTLEHQGDRPVSLRRSDGAAVEFEQLGAPPAYTLPRTITLGSLGRRHVETLGAEIAAAPGVFEVPVSGAPDAGQATLVMGPGPGSTLPNTATTAARKLLVFEDPGSWAARLDACMTRGQQLADAGQTNAGDPFLFEEGEKAWMSIPFKPVDSATYAPRADESVREDSGAVARVTCPPIRDAAANPDAVAAYAARIATGRAALTRFVEGEGRQARGPLRVVVNIFYEEGLGEDPDVLRTMDLALVQPIQ